MSGKDRICRMNEPFGRVEHVPEPLPGLRPVSAHTPGIDDKETLVREHPCHEIQVTRIEEDLSHAIVLSQPFDVGDDAAVVDRAVCVFVRKNVRSSGPDMTLDSDSSI